MDIKFFLLVEDVPMVAVDVPKIGGDITKTVVKEADVTQKSSSIIEDHEVIQEFASETEFETVHSYGSCKKLHYFSD